MQVENLSTEASNTYRNADGSYTVEAYTEPVNFEDADGDMQPIDTTLVDAPGTTYAVENASANYDVKIPENPATTPVRFGVEDKWVTMRLHGSKSTDAPDVSGSEATFDQTAKTDEVAYEATSTGLKESIKLDSAPAASTQLAYRFDLKTSPGLRPAVTESGGVDFIDTNDEGRVAFAMPPGNMIDSLAPEAAFTNAVDFRIERDASDQLDLVVTPSMEWLLASERVYPVVIDPSIVSGPSRSCWIAYQEPNTTRCGDVSPTLRVGRNANGRRRALLDFDVSAIPTGVTVNAANVQLWLDSTGTTGTGAQMYGFQSASKKFDHTATWNTSGVNGTWSGGTPNGNWYGLYNLYGNDDGYKTFDVMELVQSWIDYPGNQKAMVLRRYTEDDPLTHHLVFASNASSVAASKRPKLTLAYTENGGEFVDPEGATTDADTETVPEEETAPLPEETELPPPPPVDPETAMWSATADFESVEPDHSAQVSAEALAIGQPPIPEAAPSPVPGDPNFRIESFEPTDGDIPYAGWRPCGARDNRFKVVRDYPKRFVENNYIERSYLRFYCGQYGDTPDAHKFGYRHVLDRHLSQFASYSAYIGRNWRDLAGWAMNLTAKQPERVTVSSRDVYGRPTRFCWERRIYLGYQGNLYRTIWLRMLAGRTSVRIISAFPDGTATVAQTTGKCKGTAYYTKMHIGGQPQP